MRSLKQSTTANVMVFMTASNDHVTGKTGLTLTITASKNGAAFASISPTVTERGDGWYNVALTSAHTDTLGPLALHVTGTDADASDVALLVVAVDFEDAVRLGLSALPNAAAEAAGGLITQGTGTGQLELASGKASTQVKGMDANVVTASAIAANAIGSSEFAQAAADKVWASATRTLTALGASLVQEVWDQATSALTTAGSIGKRIVDYLTGDIFARLGAPAGASVSADIAAVKSDTGTLTGRLTAARAGYLDNLNVGGNVASSSEVTAIQNNTRVVRVVPAIIERPDSGSTTYRIELFLYDGTGNMEAPDSAPTIALVNQAGTDRSSRLDSTTMALVETGRYRAVYTASSADAIEQLVWTFTVVEGGATRKYGNDSQVVDTTAVDFTSADRTKLEAVFNKLPSKNYLTGSSNSDGDVQMDEATGNFPGSVASVVGAVGSVTGNVSGNVAGSVGSLAAQAKADVNAEVDAGLADIHLDHLLQSADPGAIVADSSLWAKLHSKSATPAYSSFNNTTDSLEAIRDKEADIEADTQDIQARLPAALVGGRIDASVGAMAADTVTAAALAADAVAEIQSGLATAAAVADVQADTDNIQTRLPAALVGGRMDSNMGAISADAAAANSLEAALDGTGGVTITATLSGNVTGSIGSLGTQAKADVNAEVDAALDTAVPVTPTADSLNERIKALDDNYTASRAAKVDNLDATVSSRESEADAASRQTALIAEHDATQAAVAALPSAAAIADSVWDEARAGHGAAGSFGEGVNVEALNTQAKADVNAEVDDALNTAIPTTPTADSINERLKTLDDANIPGRLPAALVSGRMDSRVGAMATDVLTSTALATSAVSEIQSGLATAAGVAAVQADVDDIQSRLPAALVGGRMDATVGAMQADVLTGAALAADAVTEIQAGLALEASVQTALAELATIAGYVDTEVAAIKAKTDNLPADPASTTAVQAVETLVAEIRKLLRNKRVLDPASGLETLYDDDGLPLFTRQVYEDADAQQTYRGRGANRVERYA